MFNSHKEIRIVAVDDEPEVLRVLKRILSKKGYQVMTFENPLKALDYLKTEKVHLIITDLKMPEMDGIQFLFHVKQSCDPSVPVILLTAYASIDTAVTAIQQGAFDYLRKPFEIKKIYETVERALASSH